MTKSSAAALLTLWTAAASIAATSSAAPPPAVAEARFVPAQATIPARQHAFREPRLKCHALVTLYLDRIAAYDKTGPKLNAILTLNADALARADALDATFAQHGDRKS